MCLNMMVFSNGFLAVCGAMYGLALAVLKEYLHVSGVFKNDLLPPVIETMVQIDSGYQVVT